MEPEARPEEMGDITPSASVASVSSYASVSAYPSSTSPGPSELPGIRPLPLGWGDGGKGTRSSEDSWAEEVVNAYGMFFNPGECDCLLFLGERGRAGECG